MNKPIAINLSTNEVLSAFLFDLFTPVQEDIKEKIYKSKLNYLYFLNKFLCDQQTAN